MEYSEKIKNRLFSIINSITLSNKFCVVGSFRRKNKYITDIDINNSIKNIPNLDKLIISKVNNLPNNVIFLYLTSGTHKLLMPPWTIIDENSVVNFDYDVAKRYILSLHDKNIIDKKDIEFILPLLVNDVTKLILIDELLYNKSKIRWTLDDINSKPNELKMSIQNNSTNVLHYLLKYNGYFIPIDVGLNKNLKYNRPQFNKAEFLMYLKQEYYYIVSSFKKHFYHDINKIKHIKYLTNIKYGIYKQIIMNLFYLQQIIKYNILNKEDLSVMNKYIFDSLTKINHKYVDKNNLNKIKLDVEKKLNQMFKSYAYYYFNEIPTNQRSKFSKYAFDKKMFI